MASRRQRGKEADKRASKKAKAAAQEAQDRLQYQLDLMVVRDYADNVKKSLPRNAADDDRYSALLSWACVSYLSRFPYLFSKPKKRLPKMRLLSIKKEPFIVAKTGSGRYAIALPSGQPLAGLR